MSPSTETAPLTGVQKAALVIMQLSQDQAAAVLREFSDTEVEEIIAEIVRLQRVDPTLTESVITEFYEQATRGTVLAHGGRDFAEQLLQASYGVERAAGFIDRIPSTTTSTSFDFLDAVDPNQVFSLLSGELPETRALVLAHLAPNNASEVLARFDSTDRLDVAQAIASMGVSTPEAVALVAGSLRHRARAVASPRERTEVVGGVQPLVNIINRADVATEHELLQLLDEHDPKLAEEVRARMITFADIVRLEPRDAQQVLRGIDPVLLATALKGASAELTAVVRDNMSERNRETLDDEIENLGRVKKKNIDEARAEIARAIRELDAEGTITLHRNDEVEEEYVS